MIPDSYLSEWLSKSYIGYIGVASKVQVSAGRIQALESELVGWG